ncbi:hypothetical protein [Sulfitobacter sp.]|nr:hypothetical protein [Sulfitobacter sp.]
MLYNLDIRQSGSGARRNISGLPSLAMFDLGGPYEKINGLALPLNMIFCL